MKVPWWRRFLLRLTLDYSGFNFEVRIGFPVLRIAIWNHNPVWQGRESLIGFGWVPLELDQGTMIPMWTPIKIRVPHERLA